MLREKIRIVSDKELVFREKHYHLTNKSQFCKDCDLFDHCENIHWQDGEKHLPPCNGSVWKATKSFHQEILCYKSERDFLDRNHLDLNMVVNDNEGNAENYSKQFALGVAWGLTAKYSKPVVTVLTVMDGEARITEVHRAHR